MTRLCITGSTGRRWGMVAIFIKRSTKIFFVMVPGPGPGSWPKALKTIEQEGKSNRDIITYDKLGQISQKLLLP